MNFYLNVSFLFISFYIRDVCVTLLMWTENKREAHRQNIIAPLWFITNSSIWMRHNTKIFSFYLYYSYTTKPIRISIYPSFLYYIYIITIIPFCQSRQNVAEKIITINIKLFRHSKILKHVCAGVWWWILASAQWL